MKIVTDEERIHFLYKQATPTQRDLYVAWLELLTEERTKSPSTSPYLTVLKHIIIEKVDFTWKLFPELKEAKELNQILEVASRSLLYPSVIFQATVNHFHPLYSDYNSVAPLLSLSAKQKIFEELLKAQLNINYNGIQFKDFEIYQDPTRRHPKSESPL